MADSKTDPITVLPMDIHNQKLVANTHPAGWTNPTPATRYNLVVIGAGPAGLVAASGAAGLGAKVALVEKSLLGGDCLNLGCVPSKCLIQSAREAEVLREAVQSHTKSPKNVPIDFPAVMERMRRLRAHISQHDSVQALSELNIDVFLGEGRFSSPRTVAVDNNTLAFKKAVVATGTRPAHPQIKGLLEAGFLTNETIFSLTKLPTRLAVIGGGPIGCELAQSFKRLGSQVTLIEIAPQLLPMEDSEAAALLTEQFVSEGIDVKLATNTLRVVPSDGQKILYLKSQDIECQLPVDEILVGVGRSPNINNLNLAIARIRHNRQGIQVNDYLQTTNPQIYAAGDVCMKQHFTHAADASARIVIQNALFPGLKKRLSSLTIPWCTYTDPEIARVGISEQDIHKEGNRITILTRSLSEVDRGIINGDKGFVKILAKRGSDQILGGTIVSKHAGEMISEISLAMTAGIGLKTISRVIHPYPTLTEAIKQIGDAYNRTRLTPFLKKIMSMWFQWVR
jgi:pyruvate/2-oxoglutarate dehydrogenase complex dihydrolipoamide dehydrogenase (E3) component